MKKMHRNTLFLLFLIAVVGLSPAVFAQGQPSQPNGAQPGGTPAAAPPGPQSNDDVVHPKARTRNPRYRIQADDILELAFRYTPEFDQEVTVQPDGYVQLKGISVDVHIQGQTVPEVIETLKRAYAGILHDPVISVVLRDFEKPYFIAGGQVGKPGKYDLRGPTSATQAVAIAGGFIDFAKSKQVLLFRRYNDDSVEVKVLNLKRVLKNKDVGEDLMLEPGDMLYVPKTPMAAIDRFLPRSSLGTYFSPAIL
jgi:protein involved in polysaccharide export with SLBB domain